MINNETFYMFYKEVLADKGRTLRASCTIPIIEYNLMLDILEDIKTIYPEYSNYKCVTDFTVEELKSLDIKPTYKLFIQNYIKTTEIIKDNDKKFLEITKIKYTQQEFNFILLTFNRLLWKAIIDEAYVFKHYLIGKLYAVCRENPICKPKMKWKESKANKKAIIDRGGIPRVELEARTAEFNNEEYKGEEWIERHDPFNVTIKWRRSAYSAGKISTIKDFNMNLVRTGVGNGVVNYLKDVRDNNKLEDLLIKYQQND